MVVAVATMLLLLVTTYALINFPWSDMPTTPPRTPSSATRQTAERWMVRCPAHPR